jgi:hypothetical protein
VSGGVRKTACARRRSIRAGDRKRRRWCANLGGDGAGAAFTPAHAPPAQHDENPAGGDGDVAFDGGGDDDDENRTQASAGANAALIDEANEAEAEAAVEAAAAGRTGGVRRSRPAGGVYGGGLVEPGADDDGDEDGDEGSEEQVRGVRMRAGARLCPSTDVRSNGGQTAG